MFCSYTFEEQHHQICFNFMGWDRIRYKQQSNYEEDFSKFSHCAVPRLVLLTTDVYKDDSGNSDVIIQP